MAEVSEQMEQGIKEGITMPGQEAQVEPSVAKEAAPTPAKVEETPASGEQTPPAPEKVAVAPTEPKVRFEDNPGFKNVLRQRDSVREELRKAQELNQKLMSMYEKQSQQAPTSVPNEQEAAAKQLRQILGIDGLTERLQELGKQNAELTQRETDQAFDREQDGIVKQCEKFGLDFKEVAQELNNWLNEHPYFGKQKDFQPGFFDIAFKAIYFDKSAELGQKAAHAKQLRETEKLKKGNVESPSPTGSATPKVFNSIRDKVKSMMDEGGGISFPG